MGGHLDLPTTLVVGSNKTLKSRTVFPEGMPLANGFHTLKSTSSN